MVSFNPRIHLVRVLPGFLRGTTSHACGQARWRRSGFCAGPSTAAGRSSPDGMRRARMEQWESAPRRISGHPPRAAPGSRHLPWDVRSISTREAASQAGHIVIRFAIAPLHCSRHQGEFLEPRGFIPLPALQAWQKACSPKHDLAIGFPQVERPEPKTTYFSVDAIIGRMRHQLKRFSSGRADRATYGSRPGSGRDASSCPLICTVVRVLIMRGSSAPIHH